MGRRCTDVLTLWCLAAPLAAQDTLAPIRFDSCTVARLHFTDQSVATVRFVTPVAPDSATYRYCLFHSPFCTPRHVIERPAVQVSRIDAPTGSRAFRGWVIGTTLCTAGFILVSPLAELSETPGAAGPQEVVIDGALLSAITCGGLGVLGGSQSPRFEGDPVGSAADARRGALKGALIGFAAPLAACYLFTAGRCEAPDRHDVVNYWSIPLGVLGAVSGALLGANR